MTRVTNSAKTAADILIANPEEEEDFEASIMTDEEVSLVVDTDEFDEQVQQAQEQLLALRHQQQIIERQKAEIEELKIKRQLFLTGRTEIVEKLNRSIITLERETYEAQKRVEQYLQAKDSFERHLEAIEDINPEEWSRSELRNQLSRSLGVIEDARADYQKSLTRIDKLQSDIAAPSEVTKAEAEATNIIAAAVGSTSIRTVSAGAKEMLTTRDFGYWFRSGFAFTLPLIIFGVFALILSILLG
jgi:tetratricopeptide (TPR) repeat protein